MNSRNELFDEIYFDCRPSYVILIIFSFILLGACCALWNARLDTWIKSLLSMLLLVYTARIIACDILLSSATCIHRFSYLAPHARWTLYLKNGTVLTAHLKCDSLVTRHVVVLRFQPEGFRCVSLCLLPGSLSKAEFKSMHRVLFLYKKVINHPVR